MKTVVSTLLTWLTVAILTESRGLRAGKPWSKSVQSECQQLADILPVRDDLYSTDSVIAACVRYMNDFESCGQLGSEVTTAKERFYTDPEPFLAAKLLYKQYCEDQDPTPIPTRQPVYTVPPCGDSRALHKLSRRRQWGGQGRIVGGEGVGDCRVAPWQVRLRILKENGRYSRCGGSLVSGKHVLTAAHCLERKPAENVVVIISDYDTRVQDDYEVEMGVKTVTMHPDYNNESMVADVAILTLKESVSFDNPCVLPVCLDTAFDFDDLTCTVTGWGTTSFFSTAGANILQMAHLKTREGYYCGAEFDVWDYTYVSDRRKMICAGEKGGGKDACQGDSGGPLVCYNRKTYAYVQVGVVSFGFACGRPNFPGIYTNVRYFYDWINQTMVENY